METAGCRALNAVGLQAAVGPPGLTAVVPRSRAAALSPTKQSWTQLLAQKYRQFVTWFDARASLCGEVPAVIVNLG